MKKPFKTGAGCISNILAPLCCIALCLSACDHDRFDHTPPEGQGTLVVDNVSPDDLHVYVDGRLVFTVSSYDHELVDLNPGIYRLVLDQKNGYRSYRNDLDILEGQLSVFEVALSDYYDEYSVRIYYE